MENVIENLTGPTFPTTVWDEVADYDLGDGALRVRVSEVDLPCMASVGACTGKDIATGAGVIFYSDHRYCRDIGKAIAEAEAEGELPVCIVETYQVVSYQAAPCAPAAAA